MLARQVEKFKEFYEKYKTTKFVADEKTEKSHTLTYSSVYDDACDVCGGIEQVESVHNYLICYSCFNQVIDNFFFESENVTGYGINS